MRLQPGDAPTLASAIVTHLEGKASKLLLDRLRRAAREACHQGQELDDYLDRLRLAIRMFVDDELGTEVSTAVRHALEHRASS